MSSAGGGGGCHRLGGGEPLSVCPSSSVFVFLMVRIHPSVVLWPLSPSLPALLSFYHPVPPVSTTMEEAPPGSSSSSSRAGLALPPSPPPPSLSHSLARPLSGCLLNAPLPPPIHSGGPPLIIKILPPPHACSSPSSSSCPLPLSHTTPGERAGSKPSFLPLRRPPLLQGSVGSHHATPTTPHPRRSTHDHTHKKKQQCHDCYYFTHSHARPLPVAHSSGS